MKYVIEESKCSGCSACKNVCPKKCISMQKNEEGFLYPVIDEKECIHCNLCKKTCPILNKINNNDIPKTYIAKNIDNAERINSSSGGIFSNMANYILDNNGIVYGATYQNKKVVHIAIENKEELHKLRGSKYVQSDVSNIFSSVKDNLDNKKLVLFVGTACQIGGLKAFLKNDYDNLYTCDVVCHGVPSPKVFEDYCTYLEKNYNAKIVDYNFRNKDISWCFYSTKVLFDNNKIYKKLSSDDIYMKGFLSNIFLRKSCYNCSYKENKHVSDITLGDFWGNNKYYKKFNDKKGTSIVFINSKKGEYILSKLNNIDIKEVSFDEAIYNNSAYNKSTKYNNKRESFFNDYKTMNLMSSIENNITKTPKWKQILKRIIILFIK